MLSSGERGIFFQIGAREKGSRHGIDDKPIFGSFKGPKHLIPTSEAIVGAVSHAEQLREGTVYFQAPCIKVGSEVFAHAYIAKVERRSHSYEVEIFPHPKFKE